MKYILSMIVSIIFATSIPAYAENNADYIDNLTEMRFKLVMLDDDTSVYIGMYEVKQGEWQKVIKANPSHFRKGANYPVENVSAADVKKFIALLRAKTGIAYRLPSVYEWTVAAGEAEYLNEENTACVHANFYDNTSANINKFSNKQYICNDGEAYTAAAGSYFPNENGLYDMFGNVAEWCCDPFSKKVESELDNETLRYGEDYCNKFETSGRFGVAGGNFSDGPTEMRTSVKNESTAHKFGGLGFRLAIDTEKYEGENLTPKQVR